MVTSTNARDSGEGGGDGASPSDSFRVLHDNSKDLNGTSQLRQLAELNIEQRKKYAVLEQWFQYNNGESSMRRALREFMSEDIWEDFSRKCQECPDTISQDDMNQLKQEMDRIVNPPPQYESIEDALERLADNKILQRLDVSIKKKAKGGDNDNDDKLEEKYCYYFTDGTITLRHEGDDGLTPKKIFLHDRQEDKKLPKVLVFYSASGSGKTVELVGSSASRGMDLGIIVTVQDTEANKDQDKTARKTASMELLSKKIKEVLKEHPKLQTIIGLATVDRPLKINIGLDEASGCPKLVRSIIAKRKLAWKTVVAALVNKPNDANNDHTARIKVSFSVAGTGAYAGAVGSNGENFDAVQPSARSFVPEICDYLLEEEEEVILRLPNDERDRNLNYDGIKKELPWVKTLMENARMASIAVKELRKMPQGTQIVEYDLVNNIVSGYIGSNGMGELADDDIRKALVAACALAVHLFQWDKSNPGKPRSGDAEDFQSFMSSMECGVKFDKHVEGQVVGRRTRSAIQIIVSKFGLLEPSKTSSEMKVKENLYDLFEMTAPQQLVALKMLGMGVDVDVMKPDYYGYECLTTHIVKCAIAASCVIEEKSRPKLKVVLGKIGFQLCDKSTSPKIRTKWNALRTYKAFPIGVQQNQISAHYGTEKMKTMLDIDKDTESLYMCDSTKGILENMPTSPWKAPDVAFFSPVARINTANSKFADGFVTFLCGKNARNASKCSLMIQAKSGTSNLNWTKLNEHAKNHENDQLDEVFGRNDQRLLCVAASKKLVFARSQCKNKRDVMPYAIDSGKILEGLHQILEKQRAEANKSPRKEKRKRGNDDLGGKKGKRRSPRNRGGP